MTDTSDDEIVIENEVVSALKEEGTLQTELMKLEEELREVSPQFQTFIEKQAELRVVQAKNSEVWKQVEARMIEHDIKSIKGDWGSITIAERQNFKIDLDLLPAKFIKKVPDTTKIAASYRLEGKPPKGAEPYTTRYLTKRIK